MFNHFFQFLNIATQPPPTTEPPTGIPTYAPAAQLYHRTTDYHWPKFSDNATKTDGPNKWSTGDGPFGFGSSVKLEDDTCMIDYDWVTEEDKNLKFSCIKNPKDCKDGLTLSIWEKNTFDEMVLAEVGSGKQYLVSSGADFDRDKGFAYPGFAIYRQDSYIYGVVSTGIRVWELPIEGQIYDDKWMSVALRWKNPDLDDQKTPVSRLGGLEMWINGNLTATRLFPEVNKKTGGYDFTSRSHKIDGRDPPVITLGCAWNYEDEKFDFHSNGEYDELAIWKRQLVSNGTMNELKFMMGGYSPEFGEVSAEEFNAMVGNVDKSSDNQAGLAQEVLEAMLLGPPVTTPAIPTQTPDPNTEEPTTQPIITTTTQTSTLSTISNEDDPDGCGAKLREQNETQNALASMLTTECLGSRTPEEAEMRFALAKVAAKVLSGSEENIAKWSCVEKLQPNYEGAPKTLRQMEDYMLSFVGCVNISVDDSNSPYFTRKNGGVLNFRTFGDDFVMNVDKMDVDVLRKDIRKNYPNYNGPEWYVNKVSWGYPNDTFSVPTGMFLTEDGCRDKPITISATILNEYGKVAPKRKNPTFIRSKDWNVDSRVVSTKVSVNPDPITGIWEEVLGCAPNLEYMRENPVRATLYHWDTRKARVKRRRNLLMHTDMIRDGVEVRQCAWWNEGYSYNGAWDPSVCRIVETDEEKTTCECQRFGAMAVIKEMSEPIEVHDKCEFLNYIKYAGIGLTAVLMLVFCLLVITRKYIDDMFHSLRMHVCFTWTLALAAHAVTDFHMVREKEHLNLIVGLIMAYLYTSSATWITCEAHAVFKALTSGIISGRSKIYLPFGYGTPLTIVGLLFLFYADDLGTDPRCFIAFYSGTKNLYFYYMFGVNFTSIVIALIISFNIARPQTKRLNVVADLKSQARGSVIVCWAYFIFWILAYITYIRNPESETPDFYCYFIIFLGWYGVLVLFVAYGLLSKRFRNGLRGEKAVMAKYTIQEDSTSINTVNTNINIRPESTTSISSVTETDSKEIVDEEHSIEENTEEPKEKILEEEEAVTLEETQDEPEEVSGEN